MINKFESPNIKDISKIAKFLKIEYEINYTPKNNNSKVLIQYSKE